MFAVIYKFIICMLAGIGAGFATGFSGISAAVVISPMLVSFLKIDAFDAVGIALISDVLAAAESSINYARGGHLKVKETVPLLASVLLFTFVGSWVSQYVPSLTLGSISVIWSLLMGLKFLLLPDISLGKMRGEITERQKKAELITMGCCIGFISGFAGAGGGMMTLFVMTTLLNYDIKDAVGTSVFVMTFTALVGGVSHFSIGGIPHPDALIICMTFTLASAVVFSRRAIKISSAKTNTITGIFLTVLGVIMVFTNFIL